MKWLRMVENEISGMMRDSLENYCFCTMHGFLSGVTVNSLREKYALCFVAILTFTRVNIAVRRFGAWDV